MSCYIVCVPGQVLLDRLNAPDRGGVAAVDWIEVDGNPTLLAAGRLANN